MSKHDHTTPWIQLHGKIISFNISPKGHVEGALLETASGPAQINFPKHEAELLARTMRVGSRLNLKAKLETEEGDVPVYRADHQEGEITGTIVRLNYALRGEVNGYHLDDGTFVHVKPEGAKKYKVTVGQKVKVTGTRHVGADAIVLEADALKWVETTKHEESALA